MRGRKPKPTALRAIDGNAGHRPLNGSEPRPEKSIPSCPDHLSDDAKQEWMRVVHELDKIGMLTELDRASLAGYCAAYGRWVAAEKLCKTVAYKHGELIKVNPAVRVAHDALILMQKFASEFGLTPASRARIALPARSEDDEMEEFLRIA